MKTWFKRILIGLVVVVLVAVVGAAIFLLTFDPNAYKYKLEELVQERYQRTLTIDGEIELSLFPRIGLSVQGVSLSETNSPETFASIDSMRLAVAVWPLLSDNLVVDHVTINGFKARIMRDKEGHFNFENLVGDSVQSTVVPANAAEATAGVIAGATQALTSGTVKAPRSMQIDIAGLGLKDGELQMLDAMSGMAVSVTQLNANTGRVTFNQPFDVSLTARVEGGDPRFDANLTGQALLRLDPAAKRYSAQRLDLRMDGKIPSAQAKSLVMRGNLAFNGATSSLDVAGLELLFQGDVAHASTKLTGVEASLAVPKLSLDPHKTQLQVEKLAMRAKGAAADGPFEFALDTPSLHVSPTSAGGDALTGRVRTQTVDASFGLTGISGNASELDIKEAKVNGSFKQGERVVKTTLASPVSLQLLPRVIGLAALKGDVNITDPALPKGSLQIPLIGSVSADLLKDLASAKINAVLEGGKFDLTADVTQLSTQPQLKFALAVDTLDLDKLVPPVGAAPAKTPNDGKQDESKPAAKPAVAAKPADDSLNLSGLVGPTANGSIKVGQLVMRGLKAAQVGANVKLEKGKLDISSLAADLYNGKLVGSLSVNAAEGNQMAAKLNLTGIAIEPLLVDVAKQDVLSGTGSLALDLSTAGANTYALTNNLAGTVQARLRNGAVKGINLSQTLRDLKAVVSQSQEMSFGADNSRQTTFGAMDGDMTLAKGVGTVKRLDIATDYLRVTQGSPATIDFVNSTINVVAIARVVNTSNEGKDLADLRNLPVPVLISGTFDKPVYTVQWREIAGSLLKRGVESKIKDALGGKSGKNEVGKALKGILGK
ncbi:AsmA family protein [Bordetella holmesii]|uniref:AsmA family protein n=1 Tax=Bordetella holmesii 1058 TaxID=1247648 RepID=A0ABP3BID2_9BORD|nr:AsmA family protein [Bordetella holmesii]AHV91956.1 asmA family protein [Bordetella holmesii ATCC 51541]AIT25090.1 asmA family protein [Bordetella holmesii 44057]EWM45654.1 asmA family protein [Bordetella holmesii 70147]EWM48882.1 asmA family protein [Bordetella holmesii 41130]EWM49777.1 asmA family protein [Bordetella holmesii 35009]